MKVMIPIITNRGLSEEKIPSITARAVIAAAMGAIVFSKFLYSIYLLSLIWKVISPTFSECLCQEY
jgi:hypothetical protein